MLRSAAPDRTDSRLSDALAAVDEADQALIRDLTGLIEIDTSFPPGCGYAAFADTLTPMLAPLGFETDRVLVPEPLWDDGEGTAHGDRVNFIARRPGARRDACSIYFHTDTVPAGDGWSRPPLALTRDGDLLYGRGTADMKGSIAGVLAALRLLRQFEVPLRHDPVLLFCTDEEGGIHPGIRYLAEQGLIEGHLLSFNGGAAPRIWGGCFGSVDLAIDVVGRATHSGDPVGGINAVEAALPVLDALVALRPRVEARQSGLPPPSHHPAGEPLRARADYFINSEPTDLAAITMHAGAFVFTIELTGNTRHLSKREESVDALQAGAWLAPRINGMIFSGAASEEHRSINRGHVGVLKSGLGRDLLEWRAPQVADVAYLKGSARYAPGQTTESVLQDLEALLAEARTAFPGLKTRLVHEGDDGKPSMPPFEVARNSRIVATVNRAYRTVRGDDQPTGALRPPAFYGTDAAHFYQRLGMEGVVCGPGGKFNTMPDERVDIPDYIDMVRVYLLSILEICGTD